MIQPFQNQMLINIAIGNLIPKLANMHAKNPSFLIYENTRLKITNGIAPINAYQKYLTIAANKNT